MARDYDGGGEEWRIGQETFVPLSLAAATAVQEAQADTPAITSSSDYDNALNTAAAALSRVATIYTLDKQTSRLMPLSVNLIGEKFRRGATELRNDNGTTITSLTVKQADLATAIRSIKSAGIAFGPALPEQRQENTRDSTVAPSSAKDGQV